MVLTENSKAFSTVEKVPIAYSGRGAYTVDPQLYLDSMDGVQHYRSHASFNQGTGEEQQSKIKSLLSENLELRIQLYL